MQYIKIKNWDTFQQYKDREPKWIKLHRGLLRNYEFGQLSDVQKSHLLSLWLLAAETENKIPNDSDWIKSQAQLKQKPDIEQLVASGFITLYDSVQDCTFMYDSVPREEERREEKEKRENPQKLDVFLTQQVFEEENRNFEPNEKLHEWMPDNFILLSKEKNLPEERMWNEWEKFVNYFLGADCKKPLKKDWFGTWKNWIIK